MTLIAGIGGTKLFGRVDDVDEGRYVATRFHHLFGVPLAYQGTYLITGTGGQEFQGVRIPLSWKSIGFAYLRTVLFVLVVVGALGAIDAVFEHSLESAGFAALCIGPAWFGFVLSYKWGKPTAIRRQELLDLLARLEAPG